MDEEEKIGVKTTPSEKKKNKLKYIISVLVVIVMTGLSLAFSLLGGGVNEVFSAIGSANQLWLWVMIGMVFLIYVILAFIVLIFARLYTRHYKFHQAIANVMIGAFYSDVTPSASGGEVMQVFTLKKQGIDISSAASIMVMWFILYQTSLIIFDVIAFIFEGSSIMDITAKLNVLGGWAPEVTMLPLIIIGFVVNLSVLGLLFLMSYSHHFHNFIMNNVLGFLHKIKLLKNLEKSRENLRVQVENFKIELKRLQTNIPVTILIVLLFLFMLLTRYSIPYVAGLALGAYGESYRFTFASFFEGSFLSAFHQMVTGLIPLPGSAGVSELFFSVMFSDYYQATVIGGVEIRSLAANLAAVQILWRFVTFYLVLFAGGLVTAFYKSRPKENYVYANRQTFVNLQLETFDERKRLVETLYETKQLSRKSIVQRLRNGEADEQSPLPRKGKRGFKKKRDDLEVGD
ncbi:MAG: flippase-like domain-containing protein [Bacilli bacterium]|nr:flippase-like domain-containing protein [Bacilli bacterium]